MNRDKKFKVQGLNFKFQFSILLSFLFINLNLYCQKTNYFKEFKKLSRPEKCWTILHPFVAKKAFRYTQIVRKATDSIKKTNTLDGDADGGQVDAFRHTYWMALLTTKFNWRKAYHLGKAHEKSNYLDFKHHRYEETSIPDKISSDMDMCNNLSGIGIGNMFKVQSLKFRQVEDSLQKIIVNSILKGKLAIIKKDKNGNSLDEKGNIISAESLKGKWLNNRILVPSNFKRP